MIHFLLVLLIFLTLAAGAATVADQMIERGFSIMSTWCAFMGMTIVGAFIMNAVA